MKKGLSLLIIFIMTSLFITVSASSDRIVIAPENFGVKKTDALNKRDSEIGGWDGTDNTGFFSPTPILHKTNTSTAVSATMNFYVSEAGEYRLWARVKDLNDSTLRKSVIKIDNGAAMDVCSIPKPETLTASLTWYWDCVPKAPDAPLSLTKGWHEIEVNNVAGFYARLDVIILQKEGTVFSYPTAAADISGEADVISPVFQTGETNITSDDTTVTISGWPDAADEGGIVEYSVMKKISGEYSRITSIMPEDEKIFTDSGLVEGALYEYAVRAYDKFGQYDQQEAAVSTTGTPDIFPPEWEAGAVPAFSNIKYTSATVNWTAATDNRTVAGYNIYKGSTDNLIGTTTNLSFDLTDLADGAVTTIFIEAFDGRNNKSIPISADVTTLTSVNYLLKHENFKIQTGATWKLEDVNISTGGDNILPVGKIFNNDANGSAVYTTATVYVPQDGIYYLWANVRDYATVSPGTRAVNLVVDDVSDDTKLGANTPAIEGWAWYKGKNQSLTKGWHTISVKGVSYSRFAAIYITSNPDIIPLNTVAYYTDNLKKYEDVTAPAADGFLLNTESLSAAGLKVSWSFSDISIKGARITVDGVVKGVFDSGSYTMTDLYELQSLELKIEGMDAYGNSASASKALSVSRFSVNKFELQNADGNTLTSLNGLSGTVQAVINLQNTSSIHTDTVLTVTAIDKTTSRVLQINQKEISFSAGELKEDNLTLSLPGSNYTLLLSLWEKDTYKPLLTGIKILN